MALIGEATAPATTGEALARGRTQAALVPDLLVEARRVVNTVIAGWHGRRKRGIGENFWQFRPYVEGDAIARIDWRRSARDDHTYIRDREWEAAHTVWLWADNSPSMLFQSSMALTTKETRALVPHQNATGLQVSSGVLAGMVWALENPQSGIVEPDEMDFRRCLEVQSPYLGPVRGYYTDWTPLDSRLGFFPEDLDETDPWQFKNILAR